MFSKLLVILRLASCGHTSMNQTPSSATSTPKFHQDGWTHTRLPALPMNKHLLRSMSMTVVFSPLWRPPCLQNVVLLVQMNWLTLPSCYMQFPVLWNPDVNLLNERCAQMPLLHLVKTPLNLLLVTRQSLMIIGCIHKLLSTEMAMPLAWM